MNKERGKTKQSYDGSSSSVQVLIDVLESTESINGLEAAMLRWWLLREIEIRNPEIFNRRCVKVYQDDRVKKHVKHYEGKLERMKALTSSLMSVLADYLECDGAMRLFKQLGFTDDELRDFGYCDEEDPEEVDLT